MNHGYPIQNGIALEWQSLSWASKFLGSYGLIMLVALVFCYAWSLSDHRLIREVGVWVKPMKFMLSTALFALTTVWVLKVAHSDLDQMPVYPWIAVASCWVEISRLLVKAFPLLGGICTRTFGLHIFLVSMRSS